MTEFVVDDVEFDGIEGTLLIDFENLIPAFDTGMEEDEAKAYFKVADVNELVGKTLVIGIKENNV